MKKSSLLLLALALLIINSAHLNAQVLYDNGEPALGHGNPDATGFYADTNDIGQTEIGDFFTPMVSGTANVINFTGLYYQDAAPGTAPTSDSFAITLYSTTGPTTINTSATPVSSTILELARNFLASGKTYNIYDFTGFLSNSFTLTAGTTYFLGISDTTTPFEDFAVSATSNPVSSNGRGRSPNSSTLDINGTGTTPLSFSLSVPEPKEWAFVLLGLAALGLARKTLRRTL